MSQILRALDKNEEITLTYRGQEKATIIPSGTERKGNLKSHPAFGLWANRKDFADVSKVVRNIRKGRVNAF